MRAAPRPTGAAAAGHRLKRELGATFALSWPLVLANLAVNVMPAINAVMLGQLSPRALAAGALAFNLLQPPFVLGVGVVAALAPIAAAKIGAGADRDGLRRATHQALLSALLIAAVAWIALSRTQSILIALGEPPDLAEEAAAYMRGFQWGLAPTLMFFAGRSVFAALERPRPTLVAGLVAAGFNALANYALIFGKLGMPALGVFGSGLATTLSETLMFAILVVAALIDPRMRALRLFALPWSPARRELAALWRLGLPIGATILAEVGVSRRRRSRSDASGRRRSKVTRSRCRSRRSPSWSRSAWGRRRRSGWDALTAPAIPPPSPAPGGRPSALPRPSPFSPRRR